MRVEQSISHIIPNILLYACQNLTLNSSKNQEPRYTLD